MFLTVGCSEDSSPDDSIPLYVRSEGPRSTMSVWKLADGAAEREFMHTQVAKDLAGERLLLGIRVDEQLRPAHEGPMFVVHYDVSPTDEGAILQPVAQRPVDDIELAGGIFDYVLVEHADKLRESILDALAQLRETAAEQQETRGTYLLLKLEESVIWDGREYGEIPPLLANEEFLNVNAKAVSRLRWHLEAQPSEAMLPFVVWNLCYQADVDSVPRIMEFLDEAEASPAGVRTEAIRGLAYLGHDHPEALESHMNAGSDLRRREVQAMLETIRQNSTSAEQQ